MAKHCWFARTLDGVGPCDYHGRPPDRAHLIKAQVIRREVGLDHIWDERVIVPGCRRHHGMLDHSRQIRIPRDKLPGPVEEFAAEHGLTWWLDREYRDWGLAA